MTQFIRDSITDPPAEVVRMKNGSGTTITRGMPVSLITVGVDGVSVGLVNNASANAVIGVAYEDADDSVFFGVQKSGYCDYALFNIANGPAGALSRLIADITGVFTVDPAIGAVPPGYYATALEPKSANGTLKVWLGSSC